MDKFTKKTGMEAAMAQAAAIPEIQLENMKEFFAMWTNISVDCFQQCVPAVNSKDKAAEMTCIRNCAARHVEANHRIVQQFTLQNDEFTEKKQKYEDGKMKEYMDKGIFDPETMQLQPIKPKTPAEMELETVKSLSPTLGKAYSWYYDVPDPDAAQ